MIITLSQPPAKNWLLIAEQLNDPATWDRFVPCHSADSERAVYDAQVKASACEAGVTVKPCKELLARGISVFEYDWNTLDDDILSHALTVAEQLGVELMMGTPSYSAMTRKLVAS